MNSYRVDLELRSGVSTPLAADTLWGHIAWGIRYHEGETSLRSWLERYDDGEPPIVLSDPVPAGWWPAPTLPPPATPAAPPTLKEADLQKQRSRRAWVCHKDWNSVAGGLSAEAMLALPISSPEAGVRVPIAHAAINRLSNGTAQEGGGTLYTRRRTFFADPNRFDVWVLADAPADTIRQWFNWGLLGGYGKHASSGAGHLVVCGVYEESFPTPSKPNAGLLLAAATPTKSDPHKGFVSIGVRCGRLGGLFAVGPTPSGSTVRQKRPILGLKRGGILCAEPVPAFVGRVLHNVHEDPVIRHYAMAPLLPCRLASEEADA